MMPSSVGGHLSLTAETVKRIAVYPTAPTAASWDGGRPLSRWAWVIETDPGERLGPSDSWVAAQAAVYRGACDSHADALRGLAAHLLVIAEAAEREAATA